MNDKLIFFLGGYDAEMLTIRNLLLENGIRKENICDHTLQWGAKLSEYKEELVNLGQDKIPVFIELELDISYPDNSIIIDHHNESAGKDHKTSIEQIADIIGIRLNRWQLLISANDKAYINGMLEQNATDDEIKEIRKLDRTCQGVTEKDERYAKISIKHFSERLTKNCILIDSLTERTTPITDALYRKFKHIFIITPSKELNYFGSDEIIQILIVSYTEKKKGEPKINFWFGGNLPTNGYFGSNVSLTKKEIMELSKLTGEELRICSQHIFMFPFTIEAEELEKANSPLEKLKLVHNKLAPDNSGWKYKPFKKKSTVDDIKKYSKDDIWAYNEYMYFHEYVRDTLFNETPEEKLFDVSGKQSPISLYYERDCSGNNEMIIGIKNDKLPEEYTLSVDHISLRIFETGIGILTITLYNYCRSDLDAILRINDFGRRIYPQFLGEQNQFSPDPIDAVKDSFLPDKIVFKASGIDTNDVFETNDYLSEKKHFAKYLEELLKPFQDSNKNKLAITPIIDDRMFVVCWHENDLIMNKLNTVVGDGYNYETSDDWYKYVFIDSGKYPLVQHKDFKKQLILSSTYQRFTELGTLYGVTRYSLVCLCSIDKYKDFPYRIIRNHMQKMYYQMAILLLAQRASIISFNLQLERLLTELRYSNILGKDGDNNNEQTNKGDNKDDNESKMLIVLLKKIEKLNLDILNFRNSIVFDEITPQDQGIELYQLAQKNMEIPQQLNSLSKRMETLHLTIDQIYERMDLVEERKRNEMQRERKKLFDKITLIAAIFAPLTLYSALAKFIKPFIIIPTWLNYVVIPEIFFPLWSGLFLLVVFILFYCLINDDYSEKFGYKLNWFSPLKALLQQFIFWRGEKKLRCWKILLLACSFLLFIISLPSLIELLKKISTYLR